MVEKVKVIISLLSTRRQGRRYRGVWGGGGGGVTPPNNSNVGQSWSKWN